MNIQKINEHIDQALSDAQHTIIFRGKNNTLTQAQIDEIYNHIGTAKLNLSTALDLLRPHTSYHNEQSKQ